ncbi:hypothetical protein [Paenibacillus campi]|uniref:DUF3024 domain-containing protein n=1 Tax=Paenibacillus campi TaxID=3106031 RepID=UPI002AFF819C|nr:hypothetical protein [Paenibacillus sp. SGZ-1014]
MNLDFFTVRRIRQIMDGYIDAKVPASMRTSVQIAYEWQSDGLILSELRPAPATRGWQRTAFACLRCQSDGCWHVYARTNKQAAHDLPLWSAVPEAGGQRDFELQLQYVEEDPLELFWPDWQAHDEQEDYV